MAVVNLPLESDIRARRRRGGLVLDSSFSTIAMPERPVPVPSRRRPNRHLVYDGLDSTTLSSHPDHAHGGYFVKDRRYGTHFNYDTHNYQDVCAKSSPSLVTTPSGTYNSSGSDTSSLPDFDFPEPPPLRRMQSSPFFSLDDTISPLANLLENALEMSVHLPSSSVSELVSVGAHEKGLERQGEAILRQDALREREKKLLRSSQSRLRAASSPNLHDAGASNFVTTFPPLPALPAHNTEPRKLTKMRSLRFASDCNTSSDRLDVRIRPAAMPARPKTTHTLHKGRSLSMEYLTKRISRSTPFTPSSRPTGQPQMLKAQAFRGPNPHTSFAPSHSSHVNHLGTPFLHRSMPAAPRPIPIDSPDSFASQRSFMDFSPDRDVRTRRTTFRRLMSRASMLIGWKRPTVKKSACSKF